MKKKISLDERVKNYFLNNKSSGIKSKQIAKNLDIFSEEEYMELKSVLNKMLSEGALTKKGKRYKLSGGGNSIVGKLHINRKGFGFVTPLKTAEYDIFIPARSLHHVISGDIVLVKILDDYSGKNPTGEIIKVVERSTDEIAGILLKFKDKYFVQPDDSLISNQIEVINNNPGEAKENDKVIIKLSEDLSGKSRFTGKISQVLGKVGVHSTEMQSIAHSIGIKIKFSDSAIKEAGRFSEIDIEEEVKNRIDLRSKNIFTIDPLDAKDFDDALSIEVINEDLVRVGVHIADVGFYVEENSKLDIEARERGTSTYLVNYVIPMLPENLTNNICSLVPHKDRLCFTADMIIDKKGNVRESNFYKSVIKSKRRYTYEEVEDILDSGKGDFSGDLIMLNDLSNVLFIDRIKKGSIDFVTDEISINLDEKGKVKELIPKKRLKSHKLIEEFMLLANKLVAEYCTKIIDERGGNFIYRIHDIPNIEKLEELADFVSFLGYKFILGTNIRSKNLQQILNKVKGKPEEKLVNFELIRSMAKAEYSVKNIGHFGLAFNLYTHFTSPIRRYPDLMVHRILYRFLNNNFSKRGLYTGKKLEDICKINSDSERRATEAEREAIKTKKIEYLQQQHGKEFTGIISGVKSYGLFVELADYLVEGLISIEKMPSDIYYFDERKYALIGRINGKTYRLGDKIQVRIIGIDKRKKEIDFEIAN